MTFREPVRITLLRTGGIAIVAGFVVSQFSYGRLSWPRATLLMLWPSLGGHLVELWFLNWLRPRLSSAWPVRATARIAVWFLGGVGFMLGMSLTPGAPPWFRASHLWMGGIGFVIIELLVHLLLLQRGRPSFYSDRG